ncbi:MAG TPA: GAP family protein [Streptosporangiaceae bacterium]
MLAQAVALAALAAFSPTALLVCAVYLGSASPRRTALLYLIGALLMATLVCIAAFFALRAGQLNHLREHQARYGVRLGLGVLGLALGVVVARRKPRQPDPARPQQGFVSRLLARPAPVSAFIAGLLLFTPSVTFIASVQVIATAQSAPARTALALLLIVVIDVASAWLPFLLFLAAPEATARRLKAFNAWLRAHGTTLLAAGLIVVGGYLVINGIVGLAGGA